MIAMIHFAALVITSMFAVVVAITLNWLLLRAAFALMQPATVRRTATRSELVRGTAQLARALASSR